MNELFGIESDSIFSELVRVGIWIVSLVSVITYGGARDNGKVGDLAIDAYMVCFI